MNSKRTIYILILILTIGIVGLTIAYFSNSTSIDNTFSTKDYGTTVDEEFVSPSNWLPGTTTPKTLTVTNSGSVDEAVRVSYVETWTSANSSTEGNLPLTQNGNDVAVINWANPSDWTKVTEGGVVYWYYNYKLSPTEVTSSLLESVTFNSAITNSSNCVTTEPQAGTKVITCNSTGDGYDGATYKLKFNVETVQYNEYVNAWGTSVAILEEKPAPVIQQTGAQYLATTATNASDAEYNDSTKGNMFTFTHTVNDTTVNESRYIGDAPNNYVYFNCTDDNDTSTCETWRIIGTFDVERTDPEDATKTITETRMKIVRGSDFATTMKWDSNVYNDWSYATLKTYLNGTYLESLSATAQSQIEDAIYYLGGFEGNKSTSTEQIYAYERGTTVYSGRPISWEGKVALMYPSDMYMTYAKTEGVGCYNQPMNSSVCGATNGAKSWVYNSNKLEGNSSYQWTWLLSPHSSYADSVFSGYSKLLYYHYADNTGGVRPVVYLKSDIKIARGTGEVGNPYVLE